MNSEYIIQLMCSWVIGWPLIMMTLFVALLYTIVLKGVQIRYFLASWYYMLRPSTGSAEGAMTPLQAFINTLSANLGNGSVAGMATAIYSGGPGAALWVVLIGMLLMAVRLAEVYLSIYFGAQLPIKKGLGGPMLYLRSVPGGKFLAFIYGVFCFLLSFVSANGMQVNSMSLSIEQTWGVSRNAIAIVITAFVVYVVTGGARRISQLTEKIISLKVIIFFGSSIIVLLYHYQTLLSALGLIVKSAFEPMALAGGVIGFTVQQAMRFGILRAILATESGLGTAAIMFSDTGSKQPVRDGILSMLSTFISTLVCFMIALCIVASGVWNSGLTSTALTIAAYQTVFGVAGGWIVSFLSLTFGIGVLVSFAYIARETWIFLFGLRSAFLFKFVYCAVTCGAVFINVNALWLLIDVVIAGMLIINLIGLLWLMPLVRQAVLTFKKEW